MRELRLWAGIGSLGPLRDVLAAGCLSNVALSGPRSLGGRRVDTRAPGPRYEPRPQPSAPTPDSSRATAARRTADQPAGLAARLWHPCRGRGRRPRETAPIPARARHKGHTSGGAARRTSHATCDQESVTVDTTHTEHTEHTRNAYRVSIRCRVSGSPLCTHVFNTC